MHGHSLPEVERLRAAADDADDEATRAEDTPAGAGLVVAAQTKTVGTYPTVANRFYACQRVEITGDDTVEGGPGTVTTLGDTFYALNLGASIPPSGTNVLCTFVSYRFCFRYD